MKPAGALAACVLAWFATTSAFAQALQPIPPLEARVTDATGTLTAAQQAALEQKLADFEKRKGSQLALLMIATTEPEDIAQYAIRVVEAWQLGRAQPDDGALLLVAKDDRRLRIEVGYGLEGALTDATSRRIIAETITPLFRQGDFYAGIDAGLDQMMRVVDGEPLPPPDEAWKGRGGGGGQMLLLAVFGVFFVSGILRRLFGRGIGSLLIGGATGGIVYLVLSALGVALLAGAMAFIFSLFLSAMSGSTWSSLPRQGGWGGGFGGGGFGGGGFGGGGFGGGGFGGGGGGFGGGGASGGW